MGTPPYYVSASPYLSAQRPGTEPWATVKCETIASHASLSLVMATFSLESMSMTLDLEQLPFSPDSTPSGESASVESASPHGTVETCEFEELLERAMEILKARRAGAGSKA
jgi:hypothetical protein